MVSIQEDGLGSGINTTRCRQGGVERYGDIEVEFVLYLFCRICAVVQHDDAKEDLAIVFSYQRFEIGDVESGTGTVGVKKVKENRPIPCYGQFSRQVDPGSGRNRMIFAGNGCGKAVFPVCVPEYTDNATENDQQPGYG